MRLLLRVSLSLAAALLVGVASAKDLTIGISQEPDTLHPVITTMSVSQSVRSMVLLPVATTNEVWKRECYLCTRIPSIENGDAKVIEEGGRKKILVTWELRSDAVWGDGKPVTGEDMRLSWEIGVTPTVTKGTPEAFDGIESVEVDAKNPKRFTLKYKEVRYDYNQLDISFVPIPAHIERPIWERTKGQTEAYEKNTAYVTDPANPGLYNGPYRVKEIKPASHVLLERNPKFPGKAAAFPTVLFKLIPNTQALEANLLAGSIDMTGGVGVTFDQGLAFQKRAKADPALGKRFQVVTSEDLIFEHIDFNLRDARLAEVELRRALTHAVDRDKLCQALFEGIQKPAASPYHPLTPYYSTDLPAYPYDPRKAEDILDAAGWKKGADGVRAKNGKRLSFTIMTTSQNKVRELVEVYLQDAWKKIGVELTIKNQPARVFFGETLRRGEYGEMGMYATTLVSPDDIQLTSFHSGKIPTAANSYGGSNYAAWKNPKVDELLDKAQVELDAQKRASLIKELLKEYGKDVPQLPLYYRAAVAIVPKQLILNQEGGAPYPASLRITRWTWDETQAR